MAGLGSLRAVNRRNLNTLWKTPAAEISGALGDLGTFLPLTLALARHSSIDLASTLVTSGLFNIITGVVFGVPLPVQPMKVRHALFMHYLIIRYSLSAKAGRHLIRHTTGNSSGRPRRLPRAP